MRLKPKIEIVPALSRQIDQRDLDAFHEDRVRQDLARFAEAPGLFTLYVERARVRFQKAGERAILERWIEFYRTGQRLVASKASMERSKSEYLQLAREHELKETQKTATLAKLRADVEEDNLRRDKAAYQREHLEEVLAGGVSAEVSDNEKQHNEAHERRQLDQRWEVHESLRSLQTLIELQHWRRQQRDRILKDRSLTAEEQSEDLQFVDDLYQQKRGELKVETRIFEEGL